LDKEQGENMLQEYEEARHRVRGEVLNVLKELSQANFEGCESLKQKDVQSLETTRTSLKEIYKVTEDIDNEIVIILAKYAPEARDLRELVSYLKITTSLNRIRTNINNYLKNMQGMLNENDQHIQELIKNSLVINKCTNNAFEYVIEMFQTFDDNDRINVLAVKIEVENSKSEDIYTILEKDTIEKISSSEGLAEEYFNLLKFIRKNIKILDRLESIAQRISYARMGGKL
jgi:phosphate transport system protein